jgi:hypothetical protein
VPQGVVHAAIGRFACRRRRAWVARVHASFRGRTATLVVGELDAPTGTAPIAAVGVGRTFVAYAAEPGAPVVVERQRAAAAAKGTCRPLAMCVARLGEFLRALGDERSGRCLGGGIGARRGRGRFCRARCGLCRGGRRWSEPLGCARHRFGRHDGAASGAGPARGLARGDPHDDSRQHARPARKDFHSVVSIARPARSSHSSRPLHLR